MKNGLTKTLGLAALAAGAWYFLDPRKGPERRERAAQSARDTYDSVERELGRIGEDLASSVNQTVGKASEMARSAASSVSEQASKAKRTVHVE